MGFIKRTKRNATRSFRIDNALDTELEAEAKSKNTSVSNLIEHVIENYLNHYRYVEQRDALTILPETMNEFLAYLDEEQLAKIGERIGRTVPMQGFLIRGVPFNEKSALDHLLHILGGNKNWYKISYLDGDHPYLFLQNNLGPKWIAFVEAYITSFYKSIGHEVKCIRVGDNLQIIL